MELSWNLCPYCGTPAPGKRREKMTMDDVTRPTPVEAIESQEDIIPIDEPPEEEPFEQNKLNDYGAP
jgi:hypothetical protein